MHTALDFILTYTDHDRPTAHRVVDQLLRLFLANALGGSQQGAKQAQQFLTQTIAEEKPVSLVLQCVRQPQGYYCQCGSAATPARRLATLES